MSDLPIVSIITPSLNQSQCIAESIESVISQDYPHLEFLVIDGGSTDGSGDIIRKYVPWLTYWVSEPDRSRLDAITKGWARGPGATIAYLNSDDTYLFPAVLFRGRTCKTGNNLSSWLSSCSRSRSGFALGEDRSDPALWR